MTENFETVGYYMPTRVQLLCLSCCAVVRMKNQQLFDELYVHVKEDYTPDHDMVCDSCGELILRKGGNGLEKPLTRKR